MPDQSTPRGEALAEAEELRARLEALAVDYADGLLGWVDLVCTDRGRHPRAWLARVHLTPTEPMPALHVSETASWTTGERMPWSGGLPAGVRALRAVQVRPGVKAQVFVHAAATGDTAGVQRPGKGYRIVCSRCGLRRARSRGRFHRLVEELSRADVHDFDVSSTT